MHSVMLVQWRVTRWYISQNVSPSVRHYMTGYFHQKANATGLWVIYRITDYTVPSGEGTECCPVSGPQGTLLFRSLSFLSVKGGGSDTNWGENVRSAQGCQKSTRLNELTSEGRKSNVRLWSGSFSLWRHWEVSLGAFSTFPTFLAWDREHL